MDIHLNCKLRPSLLFFPNSAVRGSAGVNDWTDIQPRRKGNLISLGRCEIRLIFPRPPLSLPLHLRVGCATCASVSTLLRDATMAMYDRAVEHGVGFSLMMHDPLHTGPSLSPLAFRRDVFVGLVFFVGSLGVSRMACHPCMHLHHQFITQYYESVRRPFCSLHPPFTGHPSVGHSDSLDWYLTTSHHFHNRRFPDKFRPRVQAKWPHTVHCSLSTYMVPTYTRLLFRDAAASTPRGNLLPPLRPTGV